MKIKILTLLATFVLSAVFTDAQQLGDKLDRQGPQPDSISIARIDAHPTRTPNTRKLNVRSLYRLKTAELAHVRLSANLKSETEYTVLDQTIVTEGRGTVVLEPDLQDSQIPTTYPLKLRVELLTDDSESGTLLMDDYRRSAEIGSLDFQPDKLELIGFSPEAIHRGERTEIVVLIRYKLVSTESGILRFGNDIQGKGRFIMNNAKREIEKGEGELSIPITIDTNTLKDRENVQIMINISDTQKRYSFSPLATQLVVVPVD